MHSDFAVLGQLVLLVVAFVALGIWQWYEYRHAKVRTACRVLTDGNPCPNSEAIIMPETHTQITPNTTTSRLRLRDLGVRPGGLPCGPNNAITDAGVLVGHTTLIEGDGPLVPGKGPVRTGVTVIIPHSGDVWNMRASAASFTLNGNGTVTGLDWIAESGLIEGPIALTNTHSVGDAYNGLLRWMIGKHPDIGINDDTYLPVVAECDDSPLNDIQGFHLRPEHVMAALDGATAGPVAEGAVGAGTGMSCYEFKGGIGTASRVVTIDGKHYTVGVLVNCNHGGRDQLKMFGVPVGRVLEEELATKHTEGSIVMVVATDAPLSSRQLGRVAKRAPMGLALTGATANNASGDFVIAFSTGRLVPRNEDTSYMLPELSDNVITPIFQATVEATEEAVLNCLCMAETMVGRDGNVCPALPLDRVRELLKQHGHIAASS